MNSQGARKHGDPPISILVAFLLAPCDIDSMESMTPWWLLLATIGTTHSEDLVNQRSGDTGGAGMRGGLGDHAASSFPFSYFWAGIREASQRAGIRVDSGLQSAYWGLGGICNLGNGCQELSGDVGGICDLGSRIQDLSGDRGWNIRPVENKWKSSFYPWSTRIPATLVLWMSSFSPTPTHSCHKTWLIPL